VLTLATAGRAFVGSTGLLLVTTAGVGAGIAIVGSLIAGYIKAKFPKQVALLMGIYGMSIGLGSTIAAAATGVIAASGSGWRWGSGVWALPGLIAIAAWLVVARSEKQSAPANGSQPAAKRYPLPVNNVTAWLVGFYFAANNILFFGLLSWIAPMYRGHGVSETMAGLILASFTAAFMLANPLPGLISHSEDRRIPIGIFSSLTLIGLLAVAVAPHFMPFVIIPIIACGIGGSFTLGMTLPLDNASTPDEANAWNAFVMTIGYFMGAAGPLVVGALRDLTGGFEAPMWTLTAVAVFMLGITPFLQPRHYRAEKRGAEASMRGHSNTLSPPLNI
jgi:CP family cyanate transporter-like MFS transporter